MRPLFLLFILLFTLSSFPSKAQVINLNKGWTLISPNSLPEKQRQNYPVEIPTSVLQTLIAYKTIPDPYHSLNEKKIDWVYDHNWRYVLDFEVTAEMLKHDRLDLVFEGIDTWGSVLVNGKMPVGGARSYNMFHEHVWRIQNLTRPGPNKIYVDLVSPRKLADSLASQFRYPFPAPSDASATTTAPYMRKAGFQFGWDWGPYLPDMGIWKPVHLHAWSGAKLRDIQVQTKQHNAQYAVLNAEVMVEVATDGAYMITAETRDLYQPVEVYFEAKPGLQKVPVTLTLKDPQLWWPHDLGEPCTYNLDFQLKTRDGEALDQQSIPHGIREIKLIREKDAPGESFYFEVNGKPYFAKGANLVPGDALLSNLKPAYYRRLIEDALESNMNMIRVWGGGIYENDEFYRLCDSAGILVWQDFMFACAMYPSKENFGQIIQPELEYQIKRLRSHPCIAIWCGNNEVEVAWKNWGWPKEYKLSKRDQAKMWPHYQNLFQKMIPNTLEKLAPGSNYIHTSPLSNWGKPDNFKRGNMHYWGVWHGEEPFENFRSNVPRFMSEYGFQSFPELATINSFADSEDHKMGSEVMKARQKSYKGNRLIGDHIKARYGEKHGKEFKNFVFLSQLLQKEAMKIAISSHRMGRPFCMGTLYWQLNDCWPAISWSTIDYYGRWKVAHYEVKRSYAPQLVSARISGDTIIVTAVSDSQDDLSGTLNLRLMDFEGHVKWSRETGTNHQPGEAKEIFRASKKTLLNEQNPNAVVLVAEWVSNGKALSRDLLYFVVPGDLDLPKAKYEIDLISSAGGSGFYLKLTGETLVKDLTFTAGSNFGHFNDNSIDLLPGETRTLTFKSRGDWDGSYHENLKTMHLNQILNAK